MRVDILIENRPGSVRARARVRVARECARKHTFFHKYKYEAAFVDKYVQTPVWNNATHPREARVSDAVQSD